MEDQLQADMKEMLRRDKKKVTLIPEVVPSEQISQRLEKLAMLLDSAITIPGTKIKFGFDSILGLIPGLGDSLSALLSSYIVYEAARMGVPVPALLRMCGNLLCDSAVGSVPVLGDLFDIGFRANNSNVAIIKHHVQKGLKSERSPKQLRRLALLIALLLFASIITIMVLLVKTMWSIFLEV